MEKFVAAYVTPYLFWFKVAALVGCFAAGMWLESQLKETQIANAKADRMEQIADDATKALTGYQKDAGTIHDAATHFTTTKLNNDEQFARLEGDLRNAFKNHPLPADCRPDDGRMRALSAAISAANTTAGFGSSPAVPKAP